ncbi:MAG: response regulator transcription factor [Firmicutes bacterium]|nr:response regulator transcription factor [[Eubacterium] siraeum]MCM1487277.1 response regulator transcription factor [Bacillota bacterium]
MSEKHILVCEDEDAIREFVVLNLQRAGYSVTDAGCGEDALQRFKEQGEKFSVVILDIMMPGIDGIETCKQIRQRDPNVGIIMLTAKSQETDKVEGLVSGADDYITKPFSPSELVARVEALCRRIHSHENREKRSVIVSGPFEVDTQSRTVSKNGAMIELTQIEYGLMEYFVSNAGIALDRTTILKKVWQDEYFSDDKIVDVNVRRLRMKIEDDPSSPAHIQTVWGYGYKWVV